LASADALIQPYSGHASRVSLEIYSRLALSDAEEQYDAVIDRFSVWPSPLLCTSGQLRKHWAFYAGW